MDESEESPGDVPEDPSKPPRTEAQKASAAANLKRGKEYGPGTDMEKVEARVRYVVPPEDGAPEELQEMRHVVEREGA